MTIGSTNSITAHTDWYATIEVTTTVGTMVTCNGVTKEATTGYVSFTVYKSGTYTITGTLNGHTNSITQYVYSAQYYYVTLYMSSTIRVNAPVNTVVTIGSESQTVTGTYVDFTVYSTGTYTVTGVLNGITATNTVYVGNMGQTYSTTLVFGCYVNIYSNIGTDVIYNGLRQTVGDTGYVRYWITGTGTHKFLCIYKGQSKARDVVVTSTASDIDESIYFVPSAYQELEYLKSDGYSWIDTDVSSDVTASWNIKTRIMNFDNNRKVIVGSYLSDDESCLAIEFGGTSNSHARQIRHFIYSGPNSGGSHYEWISQACTLNTILDTKLIWNFTTKQLYTSFTENNYTYSTTNNYSSYTFRQTGTSNFLLFSDSRASRAAISYPLAIYSCTIEKNGNIVRNFIPCYRKSDSELGMYDIVTETFYTNDGTGSFTAGPMANLPAEYQELEYLKSDGYSWIDTGVNGQSANNFEVDVLVPTGGQFSLGGYNNSTPYNRNYLVLRSITIAENGFVGSGGSGYYQIPSNTISLNTRQLIKSKFINGVANFTVNGRIISLIHSGTDGDYFNGNIYLFGLNIVGGTSSGTIATVYSCKIYSTDNTTLLRCFIPCKRKSDSVLGMYDLVNGVFYTNAGTGTFTAGNPTANASLPSEYTYVKYVASTSAKTQYLNLGETGSDTTGMLIKVYDEYNPATSVIKDDIYVGGRATQNGRFWVGGVDREGTDYTYFGWNTLNRMSTVYGYPEDINCTHTLRTFFINYLNNRQEGYDNTKAFDITETLVQSTPLYAFAASNNGSLGLNSWMRLYYTVLTSGTSVSNIFIPCYRNSDNVIGMYDIVKGNFKTNAGSGSFVDGGYLPSTYQQVEYIQSDGNQYILTGIIPQDNMLIDIKFNYLRASDWLFLAARDNNYLIFVQRNRFTAGNGDGAGVIDFNPIIPANEDAELHINLGTNGGTMSVSGSKSGTAIRNGGLPSVELILFGRNYTGSVTLSAMKLYKFIVKGQGNNYNFVPCYRKSDNVAGMFDTENMVFYENSGTGTFTVGPDVN